MTPRTGCEPPFEPSPDTYPVNLLTCTAAGDVYLETSFKSTLAVSVHDPGVPVPKIPPAVGARAFGDEGGALGEDGGGLAEAEGRLGERGGLGEEEGGVGEGGGAGGG